MWTENPFGRVTRGSLEEFSKKEDEMLALGGIVFCWGWWWCEKIAMDGVEYMTRDSGRTKESCCVWLYSVEQLSQKSCGCHQIGTWLPRYGQVNIAQGVVIYVTYL